MKCNTITFLAPLALIALASVGAGCAKQSVGDAQTQRASSELQMSNADYVKNRAVGQSVHLSHAISDADLDWTLGLLTGAKNSLVRARAMTILAQVHPLSAAQKAKIAPAAAPYLNNPEDTYRHAAARVQQALSAP